MGQKWVHNQATVVDPTHYLAVVALDGDTCPFGVLGDGEGPFQGTNHSDREQVDARKHWGQVARERCTRAPQQDDLAVTAAHFHGLRNQSTLPDCLHDDVRTIAIV